MARMLSKCIALLGAVLLSQPSLAQDWKPARAVRIIVPIQGGTVDLLARLTAPHLQAALGQPVVVESKPGAGGNLGTDIVAKAAPDGLTILAGFTAPITVNPTLFGSKMTYDPLKDLAPITLAVTTPQFLAVNPSVPANTVAEFIAYAKKNPGKMSYASVSIGSASHLTMEMLKSAAGINLVHIPYKGSAPAITALLAGQVQAAMSVPGNVLQHMRSGKLKLLASTGRKRFAGTPDIPTLIESGFPDFEAVAWIGFLAPGGTPRNIIDTYNREIVRILALPAVKKRLLDIQFEIVGSTPEEFDRYIRWETPRWAKVIRDTGAKVD
ncbi:MAG TPA: tripartite tricarboxylate transporter substrate binding protein [Burkholderiales bacterium]|nr:tripartite tricarboxylate transporter substrate binding protein [Burkholderiales bacterium]